MMTKWNGFGPVSSKGIAWAVAIPTTWILVYALFLAHLWHSLGRWPHFGENVQGPLLQLHFEVWSGWLKAMVLSLAIAAAVGVPCLFKQAWRPIFLYMVLYAMAVGVAWGALMMAPKPFLNWFFD